MGTVQVGTLRCQKSLASDVSLMDAVMNNTGFLTNIKQQYDYVFTDLRDPRVDDWFLMSSVWPTVGLCALYYYIIRIWGPKFMKDREPYNIQTLITAYNLFQTLFSVWIFQKACRFWLTGKYNWLCQPVDFSYTQDGFDAADMTWWYFFSKFVDFFDSFFFVARKKFSHLSTLHVVHHGGLPIAVWFGPKFVGGGHTTFCGFLNSGVHVAMYLYYFLAALGPTIQPYLWWKRYLTRLQMAQFVIFFAHAMQPLFIECDYPKIYCWIILGHGVLYFCLFSNFYSKSYMSNAKNSKSQVAKEKTDEKQEKQMTNGSIQWKDKEDKEKEEEKEEEEESWEVLKSATTTDDDRIETNGMVKKIQ